MITLVLEKYDLEAIIEALEIAMAWHKKDLRFSKTLKTIRNQMK